jgi:hypothetical protein
VQARAADAPGGAAQWASVPTEAPRAMIYRFTSKAAGDTIMLGPNGDQLLRLLGREPSAKGIIEAVAMPAAIAAIRQAIADDEARRRGAGGDEEDIDDTREPGEARRDKLPLRRRLWPMLQMLERSHAAGEPVVWGV